jgi:hypothetical protein
MPCQMLWRMATGSWSGASARIPSVAVGVESRGAGRLARCRLQGVRFQREPMGEFGQEESLIIPVNYPFERTLSSVRCLPHTRQRKLGGAASAKAAGCVAQETISQNAGSLSARLYSDNWRCVDWRPR